MSVLVFLVVLKVMFLWFFLNERSLLNFLFDLVVKFLNVFGVFFVVFFIIKFDWCIVFLFIGMINVLFMLLFWFYYEKSEKYRCILDDELKYI